MTTHNIRSLLFLACLATSGFAQVDPPAPSPDPEAVNLGKVVRLYRITEKKAPPNRGSCGVHIAAQLFDALGTQSFETAYPRLKETMDPTTRGISPDRLIEEFQKHGLEAQKIVNASPSALRERIDAGFPAVAIVQPKAPDPRTHWVLVTGYATDEFDEVSQWCIDDNGVASGTYSNADFMKLWNIPTYKTKNIYLHIEPGITFPEELPAVASKLFTKQTQLEQPQPTPPVAVIQQPKRAQKPTRPPVVIKQQKKPVEPALDRLKRLAKQLSNELDQLKDWIR